MSARQCSVRRYAHGEGLTHFAMSPDGKYVITGGEDSDVRVYEDIDDDSCAEFSVASEKVTAIVCWSSKDRELKIAVATDDYTVLAYTYSGSSDGMLVRFTSPINHLSVNKANTLLAAGSSDFQIKIVSLEDYAMIGCFAEHTAPVLSMQFDPTGEFLASSSCDGTFKLWGIKSQNCVASLKVLPLANDVTTTKSLCRLAWQPNGGKVLAVPVESEVKIYERMSWKPKLSLADDYHQKGVNVVCWSHDADYLAVGGVDGRLSVWNYGNQQLCLKLRNDESVSITCLSFHLLKKDCIIFADKEGHIGSFDNTLPTSKLTNKNQDSGGYNDLSTNEDSLMEGITHDDLFNDDIADDYNDRMSDMDSLSKDGRHSPNKKATEPQQKSGGGDDMSEDHMMLAKPAGRATISDDYFEHYQDAFQPSETPRHLQHRFMVYNLVGVVFSHDEDDGSALIEVEFHDTSVHHSFTVANHDGYTMAVLTEVALVLASEISDDVSSQLHCVHFNTWDNSRDWTVPLPAKESVKAIAVGDSWIAVATNLNMLRLFTIGGIQLNVLCIPGPVVAMAAHVHKLSIAYSSVLSTPNNATLYLWELDMKKHKQLVLPNHPLPLSHRTQLVWIGYSTEGVLVAVDSAGMVRGLCTSYGTTWTPILDMSNNLNKKTDMFFVIGVTHDPYEIKCVHCKGLPYPPTYPRPIVTSLPVHLPLCNPTSDKTSYEEEWMISQLHSPVGKDSSHVAQALIKLFALSCKNGRFYRAVEAADLLPTTQSLQLALTYASRSGNSVVAERINDIIRSRSGFLPFSDNEEFSDEEQEDMQLQSVSSSSRQGSREHVSSNSFRHFKKLPPSYKRSSSLTEKVVTNKKGPYDDDVMSDNDNDDDVTAGSHDLGDTPDEENNTLQLFDDDDDDNVSNSSKGKAKAPVSKSTKPALPFRGSQSIKANPFKVSDSKPVAPLKKKTSFLESIATSAVEEASTKTRKRQSSDPEGAKPKKSKAGNMTKKTEKKVQKSLKSSFGTKKGQSKALNNQTVDINEVTTTVKETQSQTTTDEPPKDTQHDEDTHHDKDSQQDNNSNDTNNVPSPAPVVDSSDNSNQLSSKEKLAKFSFEQKS